ncbi:MAG: TIGR00730 family Rossman fold protein [Bacteroidia bacterium]|jgi:uncharacterized protein (TIGR00730 family)
MAKYLAVYCGAASGINAEYVRQTTALGKWMAESNVHLVYGGGRVGLMGVLADAVLEHGGEVVGVIPDFLYQREVGHDGVTELIKVGSMHERKLIMFEKSDAFLALPGGFGTLDELFEMLTWSQLQLHKKPIGLFNLLGFYDGLLQHVNHMQNEGFLHASVNDLLIVGDDIHNLLNLLLTQSGDGTSDLTKM